MVRLRSPLSMSPYRPTEPSGRAVLRFASLLALALVWCPTASRVSAAEVVASSAAPAASSEASGEVGGTLGLDPIFFDDFETGDVVPWSNVVGLPEVPDVFRATALRLRDPHVFVEFSPLCWDFTDTPIPLTEISFNGNLADLIEGDADGDDLLDLSLLMLFRPLDVLAAAERMDFQNGACSVPAAATSCQAAMGSVPAILSYDGLASGTCSQALAGTTGGYSPPVPTVSAPCFASQEATLEVDLLGVTVQLQQAQLAGTFVGEPVSDLTPGLLRGFLSEEDADALLLPPELPLVGGQPLSLLLPGGTGNCAAGDDRDLLDGVTGWWFYLEMQSTEVPFSE